MPCKHYRQSKMLPFFFFEFFAFFILQFFPILSVSGISEDNRNNPSEIEELFRGRLEAPNKSHILDSLFKGYDRHTRPYYREKPVMVSLYAVIDSFHDINEEQMEYQVEVMLKEIWRDPRLAYGNASWFVRLKGDTLAKVWYPDTMIENSRKHEVDYKTRTAYLLGDGTIFLSEWIKATLTSHMDFRRYPMDVQKLRIQIAAYSYDDSQVQYEWSAVLLKEHDMTEFYVEKQTVRLEATSSVTGAHTAAIAEFQVRRRLQHFILAFYLPCIACAFASWIQFWMEVTAIGDRVSLGITTVLTGIFLVGFSSQDMPKASYVKAAELYLVVSFGFTFMALLESALAYKLSTITSKERRELKSRGVKENHKNPSSFSTPFNEFGYEEHNTVGKNARLSQNSTKDSFSCTQGSSQTLECIVQNVQTSHSSEDLVDQSSTAASSLGLRIDQTARILFPLTYTVFTIVYLVLI